MNNNFIVLLMVALWLAFDVPYCLLMIYSHFIVSSLIFKTYFSNQTSRSPDCGTFKTVKEQLGPNVCSNIYNTESLVILKRPIIHDTCITSLAVKIYPWELVADSAAITFANLFFKVSA